MSDTFGGDLGKLLGGMFSSDAVSSGIGALGGLMTAGAAQVAPYNIEGASTIPAINNVLTGDVNIGSGRLNAPSPIDFETFASNYNMSPGAQYLLKTQQDAQDASAAAKGGFYSGANMRAQTGIAEGIANQDLVQQYQQMLAGQQQDYAQRQGAFQNLFQQETLGEKAGGTQASMAGVGATALGPMYAAQAQAQNQKGSGIGSLFGDALKAITTFLPGI